MNAQRKKVEWHWPREALAQHYLDMFTVVQAHSMVLFAPRGKGKTEFMTKDIMPAAEKDGYFPVYVNFWDKKTSPAESLRYGMLRAAEEAGIYAKLREFMTRAGGELSMGVNLGVANVSVKSKIDPKYVESDPLFEMRQIVDNLRKCVNKPILFVFDEVQTLALRSEHEEFVRSFRVMLDERRGKVYSIFTGSSQSKLTEMFARIKAPLYNFSTSVDFPPLGDDFLRHWINNVQKIMGDGARDLTLDHMREGFNSTDRNPRIFWNSVLSMIQSGTMDIVKFAREAAEATEENAGVKQRLAELTAFDRLVLAEVVKSSRIALEEGEPVTVQMFSKDTREKMGEVLGVTPTPSQVQKSLHKMMAEDMQLVVSKARGRWELEDTFWLDTIEESLTSPQQPALLPPQPVGRLPAPVRM